MKLLNIALIAMLFAMASCKTLEGTFSAREALVFNGKRGKRGKKVRVPKGSFAAQLKMRNKKKMTLKFHAGGQKKKIVFRLPDGTYTPGNNESLRLSARETKQPYDLNLDVKSNTSTRESTQTFGCTRQVFIRTVCQTILRRRPCYFNRYNQRICPPPVRERVCRNIHRTVSGLRTVTYAHETTLTKYLFRLMDPNDGMRVGDFISSESKSKTYTLRDTGCLIR